MSDMMVRSLVWSTALTESLFSTILQFVFMLRVRKLLSLLVNCCCTWCHDNWSTQVLSFDIYVYSPDGGPPSEFTLKEKSRNVWRGQRALALWICSGNVTFLLPNQVLCLCLSFFGMPFVCHRHLWPPIFPSSFDYNYIPLFCVEELWVCVKKHSGQRTIKHKSQ